MKKNVFSLLLSGFVFGSLIFLTLGNTGMTLVQLVVAVFCPTLCWISYRIGVLSRNTYLERADEILDALEMEHDKNLVKEEITLMDGDILRELQTTIGIKITHMTGTGPVVNYTMLREIRTMINIQKGNFV